MAKKILFTDIETGVISHEARIVEDRAPWVGKFGFLFLVSLSRLRNMKMSGTEWDILTLLFERAERGAGRVKFSPSEVAHEIGCTRETASATKSKFLRHGLLFETADGVQIDARIFHCGKLDEIPALRQSQHLRLVVDNSAQKA